MLDTVRLVLCKAGAPQGEMVLGLQVGSEVEWLRIVQRVALPGFSVELPWGSAAIMAHA